jgi:hypothetical protein
MIDSKLLLEKCQKLQKRLEIDLLERSQSNDVPAVGEKLQKEYQEAFDSKRTGHAYETWRQEMITQHAAAWVVTTVFVRFLEDNRFLEPRLSGPPGDTPGGENDRWLASRDNYDQYFVQHRDHSDRDYLLSLFDTLAALPALADLFGKHNPLRDHPTWLSNDAAQEIREYFRRLDPATGKLELDFTTPAEDARHPDTATGQRQETRFLGDLYQDLSEDARKRFALLQTPDFVEQFILDRTLEPAWEEWLTRRKPGDVFRMIDPACGSGHFLLGAFHRILNHWQRLEPATPIGDLVRRSLDSVHGVDVNPFAVAISKFRLLIAALRARGEERVRNAPDFHFHLACGDSLLHGPDHKVQQDFVAMEHFYQPEDLEALRAILVPSRYHAVVANPPYITVKDKALNEAIRKKYKETCSGKYSLGIPFTERLFQLAAPGYFTGQITADSFMKREFGGKLIESFFPTVDLTHVIHTSGAYIPGHGTPTVILFGRKRLPILPVVRAVLGIQGEPSTPADPAQGLVWTAILDQVDQPDTQSRFISSLDMEREKFHSHPWSIGGGGASELKAKLDLNKIASLESVVDLIGVFGMTNADDVFLADRLSFKRRKFQGNYVKKLQLGDEIRDWLETGVNFSVFPYTDKDELIEVEKPEGMLNWLWPTKTTLGNRATFSKGTYFSEGLPWWKWHQVTLERLRTPLSITFAFVATHNHFVLDRGGKVFNRSAPVIKLPAGATEDDHLVLLGLLNSSAAGFWMRQVFHNKGSTVDKFGARQSTTAFEDFYEYDGTKLKQFPIPWDTKWRDYSNASSLADLATKLDTLSQQRGQKSPANLCSQPRTRTELDQAHQETVALFHQMVFWQEELDWASYAAYGLIPANDLATGWLAKSLHQPLQLGQRAFEIALARKVAAGEEETEWFRRHGSTPITEIPSDWPEAYRKVVARRLELIENNPDITLIEKPEFKRRWNQEPWQEQEQQGLRDWLLLRLERYLDLDGRMAPTPESSSVQEFQDPQLVSLARLAQVAGQDADFLQMGGLYRNDPAFDVLALVRELVEAETVPALPVCRYKGEGLTKRAVWERTWALQRAEDRGEPVGNIPVPPKYINGDFQDADYWRLRGKLDVPKERWVGFPGVNASDGTPVVAWAGYDHLQLAQAISGYFVQVQEQEGGTADPRLEPLLACLDQQIPWLKQWHNDIDPSFGQGMGDYFAGFLDEEARRLGKTVEQVRQWQPPARGSSAKTRQPRIAKAPAKARDAGDADASDASEKPAKEPKARKPRAGSAEREAQKAKLVEFARTTDKLTNRACLEELGLDATSGNTALVSQLLKDLSAEDGPLEKVGTKGTSVYYRAKG